MNTLSEPDVAKRILNRFRKLMKELEWRLPPIVDAYKEYKAKARRFSCLKNQQQVWLNALQ